MIEIREEDASDIEAIREVNRRAFGQELEGNIVDALRSHEAVLLSLVAIHNRQVVGHILYSSSVIGGKVTGAALGPMAVLPEYQRQGIGSQLVTTGTAKLKDADCPFVIVLGHPTFYPRFGFQPASRHHVHCDWDVPDDALMLLVLDDALMQNVSGRAEYRPEFNDAV